MSCSRGIFLFECSSIGWCHRPKPGFRCPIIWLGVQVCTSAVEFLPVQYTVSYTHAALFSRAVWLWASPFSHQLMDTVGLNCHCQTRSTSKSEWRCFIPTLHWGKSPGQVQGNDQFVTMPLRASVGVVFLPFQHATHTPENSQNPSSFHHQPLFSVSEEEEDFQQLRGSSKRLTIIVAKDLSGTKAT